MSALTDATLALSNSLDRSLRSRSLSVCRTVFCNRESRFPSSSEAISIALLLSDGLVGCESRAMVIFFGGRSLGFAMSLRQVFGVSVTCEVQGSSSYSGFLWLEPVCGKPRRNLHHLIPGIIHIR